MVCVGVSVSRQLKEDLAWDIASDNTVWHKNFMVTKFYGFPLYHLYEKFMDFNFTEARFVLDVMAILILVDFHPVYEF